MHSVFLVECRAGGSTIARHCSVASECAIGSSVIGDGGGQVEKNVQDACNRMWQVMPVFADLAELNQWLEDRCIALWTETPHKALPGSIADVWEAEKPMLMALPPAFDGYIEHSKRVSPTCLITFEHEEGSGDSPVDC